jgi:hypothetical protein
VRREARESLTGISAAVAATPRLPASAVSFGAVTDLVAGVAHSLWRLDPLRGSRWPRQVAFETRFGNV